MSVSKAKIDALKRTFSALNIRETDIEEKFIRSRSKGGQKVNKTSSCVYLKHTPTGIEVKCAESRSQSLNRFLARWHLAERIELIKKGKDATVLKRINKRRRQKQKRKKRAQQKYTGPVQKKPT